MYTSTTVSAILISLAASAAASGGAQSGGISGEPVPRANPAGAISKITPSVSDVLSGLPNAPRPKLFGRALQGFTKPEITIPDERFGKNARDVPADETVHHPQARAHKPKHGKAHAKPTKAAAARSDDPPADETVHHPQARAAQPTAIPALPATEPRLPNTGFTAGQLAACSQIRGGCRRDVPDFDPAQFPHVAAAVKLFGRVLSQGTRPPITIPDERFGKNSRGLPALPATEPRLPNTGFTAGQLSACSQIPGGCRRDVPGFAGANFPAPNGAAPSFPAGAAPNFPAGAKFFGRALPGFTKPEITIPDERFGKNARDVPADETVHHPQGRAAQGFTKPAITIPDERVHHFVNSRDVPADATVRGSAAVANRLPSTGPALSAGQLSSCGQLVALGLGGCRRDPEAEIALANRMLQDMVKRVVDELD
ncbi:hypothetical protein PLICRDRAFT_29703 [Plicaturopsis crispa FD-325 SS-3]|nr:hypothetical protein PLICRDRAFT_29703 [Plicaturopsis crispa FD-325 SS-3]